MQQLQCIGAAALQGASARTGRDAEHLRRQHGQDLGFSIEKDQVAGAVI